MDEQKKLNMNEEGNNVLEDGFPAADKPKPKKKKNNKRIIIVAVIAAVAVAGIGYLSYIPKKQAKSEVAEYIETYEEKLSSGNYEALSTESLELQEKDDKYLSDEERNELIIRSNYALGLSDLDLRGRIPVSEPDYDHAVEALDNTNDYGVSSTLRGFINTYSSISGNIEGTLIVPPIEEKEEEGDSVSAVEGGSIIATTSNTSVTGKTNIKALGSGASIYYDPSESRYYSGDSSNNTDSEKKEEKSKPKEYLCSGTVFLGFDKTSQSGSINEGNIKTAFALRITLSDQAESIQCKEYEAIVYTEDKEDFTITGIDDKTNTAKGSFDGSTWTFDFGDGITATLKKTEKHYSSSSSGSSNSLNSRKDYSEGSEWEKYDSDKNGKISDDEFQDATGDYIDSYFEENGTDGDLNAYDYNGNGEMEDNEFQDAVNDYMNENGY